MRRKSIGATSQAFHEPMSTGAFLEFLRRLGCRDAGFRGQKLTCTARVAGSRPHNPVGQVSRGLGPGPPGLGARPTRGLGPFQTKTTQTSQITIFRKLLAGACFGGGDLEGNEAGIPPLHPPCVLGERKRVKTHVPNYWVLTPSKIC